jgi:hypothetical protein
MMLIIAGIFLFILTKMMPFFAFIMMDWVGLMAIIGGILIIYIAFPFSDAGMLYDTIPAGTSMIPYIRRDQTIVPILGKRVFPGESFLESRQIGVIEDIGVGSVLLWGRKKIRFALENLNYTPDPRFWNVCNELYRLGFDDEEDLKTILYQLPGINPVKERDKKVYYLERMAQIYWNMEHSPPRGGKRFVELLKTYKTRDGSFGPKRYKKTYKKEVKQEEKTRERPPVEPIRKDISDIDSIIDKKWR